MFIKKFEIISVWQDEYRNVRQITVKAPGLPAPSPEVYFQRTRMGYFILVKDCEVYLKDGEPVYLCSYTLRRKIREYRRKL